MSKTSGHRVVLGLFGVILVAGIRPAPARAAGAGSSLKVAVPNPVDNLDPIKTLSAQEHFVLPLIFEHFFLGNSDGEIAPELAESWSFDPKTSRLLVKLKNGRVFSDGAPVTVSDAVSSMKRYCDPRNRSSGRLIGLKGCGPGAQGALGVGAVDDRTLFFEISVHPSAFLYQLAFGATVVVKDGGHGVWLGSGPFRIDSHEKGRLVIVRNPHYRAARNDYAERIEFEFVPEDSLLQRVKAGEFDVASMYMYPVVAALDSAEFVTLKHAAQVTQTMVLNPKSPAFKDAALRKSIAAKVRASKLFECRPGQIKAHGIIPKGIGGSLLETDDAPGGKPAGESPRKSGPAVAVRLYRSAERKNDCEEDILRGIFSEFNIRLEVVHLKDYADLLPKYLDPATDGYIEYFVFTSREASSIFRKLSPKTKEPYFFYTDARVDELLAKALNEGSLTKRFSVYRRLNQDIEDHASVVPLYYVPHTNVVRKTLTQEGAGSISFNPNSFLFLLQMAPGRARPK